MKNIAIRVCLVAVVALIQLTLFTSNAAFAWSCANSLEPQELYTNSKAVFIATIDNILIEDVGNLNPINKLELNISSTLKGNSTQKATVLTNSLHQFVQNEQYLIYAYENSEKNNLQAVYYADDMCLGSKLLSIASSDLDAIAELQEKDARLQTNINILCVSILFLAIVLYVLYRRYSAKQKARPNE